MDEVYEIAAEMDWDDYRLLDLMKHFVEEQGHLPALVQYLRQMADEEKSWDDEENTPPEAEN